MRINLKNIRYATKVYPLEGITYREPPYSNMVDVMILAVPDVIDPRYECYLCGIKQSDSICNICRSTCRDLSYPNGGTRQSAAIYFKALTTGQL